MTYLTTKNTVFPTLFDEFFKEDFFSRPTKSYLAPVTDISSDDDAYEIEMEIAGFTKKDISINIVDDTLTVTGDRERRGKSRKFERSFTLDGSLLDYDGIESSLKDGILNITLPKKEEERPKTIEIKVT